MTLGLVNANPCVQAKKERIARTEDPPHSVSDEDAVDPLDIYDFVRDIRDPEHPYSLEQLSVLSEESITVDEKLRRILITFTPTIQHCSMATVIGLCLRVKLMRCFPPHFKLEDDEQGVKGLMEKIKEKLQGRHKATDVSHSGYEGVQVGHEQKKKGILGGHKATDVSHPGYEGVQVGHEQEKKGILGGHKATDVSHPRPEGVQVGHEQEKKGILGGPKATDVSHPRSEGVQVGHELEKKGIQHEMTRRCAESNKRNPIRLPNPAGSLVNPIGLQSLAVQTPQRLYSASFSVHSNALQRTPP